MIVKKIGAFLWVTFFLVSPFVVQSQQNQEVKSISFGDYGPVAFDSYWRLPDEEIYSYPIFHASSRISTDNYQSKFFTQYLRMDIPLGCDHSLMVRFPYHHFSVKTETAQYLDMDTNSGWEFGDIDIIFNIRFLKKFIENKTNNRLMMYLTGEMHTAPTGRENRQFTDVIKLLGTINSIYAVLLREKTSLNYILTIGGGGWDDLVGSSQKHALKICNMLSYRYQFNNHNALKVFTGETYIYAEGNNNEGILWKTGFNYWRPSIRLELSFGLLKYFQENRYLAKQYEFTAYLPLYRNN